MRDVVQVLRFVDILAGGVVAGGFIMVLVALVSAKREMPAPSALQLHQLSTPRIDLYIPPASVLSVVAGILIIVFHDEISRTSALFTALGILFMLAVGIASVFFNMPTNRIMAKWSLDAIPSEYVEMRQRWDSVHQLRTAFGVLAFACYIIAGLAQ
jgi:uncharacterized membrane protein